jgi:hypothetical protein
MNFVQIETKTGIKEFELVQGDITNLPFEVDILCLSAFKNDYTPTESSIIGQLFKKGINIEKLSKKPSMDFRESLGIWVSDEFENYFFKKIVCVEIIGANNSFIAAVKNLFAVISILEIQGKRNFSIALPMIGAGDQSIDDKLVISSLIDISLEFLKYSRFLNKVYFVVYDEAKSVIFNKQMNDTLGRVKIASPNGILADSLRKDLNSQIDLLIDKHNDDEVFHDLKRVLNTDFRPFEFGAITRKTIEKIIEKINPIEKKQFELIKKIESLSTIDVSQWILSYFHTIRIFGNEAVHSKDSKNRIPKFVDDKDLEIGMYCMLKIIEFYLNHDRNINAKSLQSSI